MKISVCFASLLCALLFSMSPSAAQTAQDANITISHPGFDSLKADLQGVLNLTLPAEQTQWENIEGYLDTLSDGVDGSRPVYAQILTGIKPNAFLLWVPLKKNNFQDFRDNLESLGYEVARDAKDTSLYSIAQEPEVGWARVVAGGSYAGVVWTNDEASLPVLREQLVKANPPAAKVPANMLAELTNSDGSEAAIKHRKEAFQEIRRMSMDAVKKRPAESTTEFELRQLTVKNQMDEGERLLAELSKLSIQLTVNDAKPEATTASLMVEVKALPGSDLETTMKLFNDQPDVFASIAKEEGSALSFRLNHPIDSMRQVNFLAFLESLQKDLDARVLVSKERTDAEKAAIKKTTTGVLDVLRASVKAGWANAFLESVPDGQGGFYSIVAFSAPASRDLNKVLPDLVGVAKETIVEMNIDKEGEVEIHRVVMAEGLSDLFDRTFGVRKDIFVGVGPSHLWLASGMDAKNRLKKTIAGLGQPTATTSPLHVEANFLPLVQRLDEIAKAQPQGKTPEEQATQRSMGRTRARAIAAMKDGGDKMVLDFQEANGELTGTMTFETGLIRWVGKMMSAFSKENL